MATLRSNAIRLAHTNPDLRPILLPLLQRYAAERDVVATPTAEEWSTLVDLVSMWVDEFFLLLRRHPIDETDIESAFAAAGIGPGVLGELETQVVPDAGRVAGPMADRVVALGGSVLKWLWDTLTHPFHAAWKLFNSKDYRKELKRYLLKALRREGGQTRHLWSVVRKVAAGGSVEPAELRKAALQFIDLFRTVAILAFVAHHFGPDLVNHPLQVLATMASPADEVLGILLDKPLQMASRAFLGQTQGFLPSSFYDKAAGRKTLMATGGQHIEVRDLPPVLQRELRSVGYGRRDIMVEPRDTYSPLGVSGDGYRAFVIAVDLATGQSKHLQGNWGGASVNSGPNQVDSDLRSYPLPFNTAVISGHEGGGHPVWAFIMVHKDNLQKLLPSGNVEHTEAELVALQIIKSIRSGARAEFFADKGLGPYKNTNPTLQSLASKGLVKLTGAGIQITTAGKNVVEANPRRDGIW